MKFRDLILLPVLSALSCAAVAQGGDSVSVQVSMQRITVSSERQAVREADRNGNYSLNMDALYAMPHFAGAADVMRILQFMPGVAASAGGDAGIYVRGGDGGQNRILFGGAPIYSPSHLFGFFSVFNSAHLGGLTLLKSHIPASYGSALSSITDVRTLGHVPDRLAVEGNVGIIESDVALRIPAGTKTGVFVSARHSYASWLLAFINNDETKLRYEFGDYGVTLVHDAGRIGKLTVNSHFNHDSAVAGFAQYDSRGTLRWWNSASSVTLRSRLSDSAETENTLYLSLYDNSLDIDMTGNGVFLPSSLLDAGAGSTTTVHLRGLDVSAGAQWAFRRIAPQTMHTSIVGLDGGPDARYATNEAAVFVSALYTPLRSLEIDAGVRASVYLSGKYVAARPEPRVMVSVPLSDGCRLWAAYDMSVQYLQLVPQSNVSFATDFYVGSSAKNPPSLCHNANIGYGGRLLDGRLGLSAEAFYRRMFNVIEYDTRLSTMLTSNCRYDEFLYSGDGEAYGLETSLSYSVPQFSARAAYTLSRSLRRFEQINGGRPYPAKSDRRHNLSLMAVWEPSARWTLSASFLYATGGAYTAPVAIFTSGGSILKEYGPYNGSRLPDMHRLDLSATCWIKRSGDRRNGINLSVYNIYARKNPLTVSWAVFRDHTDPSVLRISQRRHALYTIVPSLSWTFRF